VGFENSPARKFRAYKADIGRLHVSTIEFPHFSRSRHGLAKPRENWSCDDEIGEGILDCLHYYFDLPANERWYDFKPERCKSRGRAISRF
jgi:hypothetical protein